MQNYKKQFVKSVLARIIFSFIDYIIFIFQSFFRNKAASHEIGKWNIEEKYIFTEPTVEGKRVRKRKFELDLSEEEN